MLEENISLEIGLYRNYSAQPVITDQAVITEIFFTIKNPYIQIKSYFVLNRLYHTQIFCEEDHFISYLQGLHQRFCWSSPYLARHFFMLAARKNEIMIYISGIS